MPEKRIAHAAIKQFLGAGARKAVHIVLHGGLGLEFRPQILRQPMRHGVPLIAVEEGRVVQRQRGDFDLAGAHGLEELGAALGTGGLPPIVDRDGGFGSPLEPRSLRRGRGSQRGVEREVEVAPLHVAAHRRVIGEPVIRVREMDQVHLLDELQSRRGRFGREGTADRAQTEEGKSGRRARTERLIHQLNLGHIRTTRGYALSGGERRRVEIARSLCIQPNFILLDEPFSGIDPIAVLELQKIIFDLKAGGIGVLITDHNVRETLSVTDRAYIIAEGRIFRAGTPRELGNDVEVRRVYLGEGFTLT